MSIAGFLGMYEPRGEGEGGGAKTLESKWEEGGKKPKTNM